MPEKLLVKNNLSPGDYVVLTAAIRDLHSCYPGKYITRVETPQPAVFSNNPDCSRFPTDPKTKQFRAGYNNVSHYTINKCNEHKAHFMWGFIGHFNKELNLNVKLTDFRPALYLTQEEKETPLLEKPYWIFASGGKRDYTAKWWDPACWQAVADLMQARGHKMIQVGGGSHTHPPMRGVTDLVAKTTFRELIRLIYHAEGVMCVVTCLMHIAAALNRPCVVVSGGREPWWWEAYDHRTREKNMRMGYPDWKPPANDNFIPHRFLDTLGQLDCCTGQGCWRNWIVRTPELDDQPDFRFCSKPAQGPSTIIPKCLQMITPEMVVENAEWYYQQGILSRTKAKLVLPPVAAEQASSPAPVLAIPAPVEEALPLLTFVLRPEKDHGLNDICKLMEQQLYTSFTLCVEKMSASTEVETFCQKNQIELIGPEKLSAALGMAVVARRAPSADNWRKLLHQRMRKADCLAGVVSWKPVDRKYVQGLRLNLMEPQEHPLQPGVVQLWTVDTAFVAGTAFRLSRYWPVLDNPVLLGLAAFQEDVPLVDCGEICQLL